jgi:tRNA(Ile)-lysidine synthase
VRRADVEHYAAERGLTWRDDGSNRDLGIPRNAVRHTVLPALMGVAGPRLPERLARQAHAWRDDERWLAACVAVELPSVLMPHADGGWLLDLPRLDAVPPMLRRRVRMAALEEMLPRGRVSLALVDALERLDTLPEGRVARLGGLALVRSGAQLRVMRADGAGPTAARIAPRVLDLPGAIELGEASMRIEASVLRREVWQADAPQEPGGLMRVALDAGRVGATVVVRSRQPGDRMRPRGAPGSQKIQDLMVNRKVPRHDRDRVPVVTSATGEIAWVVGLAVGEEFAIQPHTAAVLLLQATRSGGRA